MNMENAMRKAYVCAFDDGNKEFFFTEWLTDERR